MKWMLLLTLLLPIAGDAADSRAQSVAETFDKYCLSTPPTFSSIDRLASEASLRVADDRRLPMPDGSYMHQKIWLLTVTEGAATMLTSSDLIKGDLRLTGCGVYNPDIGADALEGALSRLPRMGPVKRRVEGPLSASTTWWWAALGMRAPSEDSQVMMTKNMPNMPGVNVSLLFKTHL